MLSTIDIFVFYILVFYNFVFTQGVTKINETPGRLGVKIEPDARYANS